jgi:hypothetical protein
MDAVNINSKPISREATVFWRQRPSLMWNKPLELKGKFGRRRQGVAAAASLVRRTLRDELAVAEQETEAEVMRSHCAVL